MLCINEKNTIYDTIDKICNDKKRRQKAKLLRSYASRDDLSVISDKNTGTGDMIQIITWV